MNFQDGTVEMEEKVPRDLEELRDRKVIKANQYDCCKTFLVYSVCSVYSIFARSRAW